MNRINSMIIILLVCGGAAIAADANLPPADVNSPPAVKTGKTYVMIVSGINKDPVERQSKDKAVKRLRKFFLTNVKVKNDRVKVLVDENSFEKNDVQVSTSENLTKTIDTIAATIKPEDRFVFYYVGSANLIAGNLRLNLPDKDITAVELAMMLNKVKASSQVLIFDCPGAGLLIKSIQGDGRIVIASCRSDQVYSPRFSDYFIPALTSVESDTNEDGRVSVLEAFTAASKAIDDLYRQQDLLKTENPILEDNGDSVPSQQPWRFEKDHNDGLAASKFFFSN